MTIPVPVEDQFFSSKDPRENAIFTLDFANDLAAGETITGVDSFITFVDGPNMDIDPSAMLNGVPAINGTKIGQYIHGGTNGNVYKWVAIITTSLSQELALAGFVQIAPA